jgi:hypothetical protein
VIWDFGFWILNFELGTHWILLIKRDLSRTRIRPDCASTSELNGFEGFKRMASANDGWREEDRLKARWIFAYGEDRLTRLDGPLILMIFMVNYDHSFTTRN